MQIPLFSLYIWVCMGNLFHGSTERIRSLHFNSPPSRSDIKNSGLWRGEATLIPHTATNGFSLTNLVKKLMKNKQSSKKIFIFPQPIFASLGQMQRMTDRSYGGQPFNNWNNGATSISYNSGGIGAAVQDISYGGISYMGIDSGADDHGTHFGYEPPPLDDYNESDELFDDVVNTNMANEYSGSEDDHQEEPYGDSMGEETPLYKRPPLQQHHHSDEQHFESYPSDDMSYSADQFKVFNNNGIDGELNNQGDIRFPHNEESEGGFRDQPATGELSNDIGLHVNNVINTKDSVALNNYNTLFREFVLNYFIKKYNLKTEIPP